MFLFDLFVYHLISGTSPRVRLHVTHVTSQSEPLSNYKSIVELGGSIWSSASKLASKILCLLGNQFWGNQFDVNLSYFQRRHIESKEIR